MLITKEGWSRPILSWSLHTETRARRPRSNSRRSVRRDAFFHFPWRPGDKHTTLTLTIWDDDQDEKDDRGFLGKVDLTGKQLIARA
jgi:hypothetical protein